MFLTSTLFLLNQVVAGGPSAAPAGSSASATHAAAPTVAGRVVTESEVPLPGVVVSVQGTAHITSTNADGDFLLPLADAKTVLVFKCQGYRDQTLSVSTGTPLTVKMYSSSGVAAPAGAVSGRGAALVFSEVLPTFPGGDAAYAKFIGQNARYPEAALAKGISGKVYVSFVVDEDGRITDAEIARSAGDGFDEEALRLIRLMPWWNPGKMAGKPVRVTRTLAVPFVIRERR
ncbi:MAG TPA: TonB family protein [Hymenobacter sp.]